MSEAFKVGDVVRLKSGGPGMTVREVLASGVVVVVFYDFGDGYDFSAFGRRSGYRTESLPAECLVIVEPKPVTP